MIILQLPVNTAGTWRGEGSPYGIGITLSIKTALKQVALGHSDSLQPTATNNV